MLCLGVQANQFPSQNTVTDPNLITGIRPDIVRSGIGGQVIFDLRTGLDINLAHLGAIEDAVPDGRPSRVDPNATDAARLCQSGVFGELLSRSIEHAYLASEELREPHTPIPGHDPVRKGIGGGDLPHSNLFCLPIPLADAVSDDHGKPDVPVLILHRCVGSPFGNSMRKTVDMSGLDIQAT